MKIHGVEVVWGFALLAAGGCTGGALHPFYAPETLVQDSRFVGTWRDESDQDSYDIRMEDEGYLVTWTTKQGRRHHVVAHLFDVGEHRFVDLFWGGTVEPSEEEEQLLEAQALFTIPLHFCLWVGLEGDRLQLRPIDADWLRDVLRENPDLVAHAFLEDDRIVLTAPTAELYRFLERVVEESEALGDPGWAVRVPAKSQAGSKSS